MVGAQNGSALPGTKDRVNVEVTFSTFGPGSIVGVILDPVNKYTCRGDRKIDLDRFREIIRQPRNIDWLVPRWP
jgi:hypothetical protein